MKKRSVFIFILAAVILLLPLTDKSITLGSTVSEATKNSEPVQIIRSAAEILRKPQNAFRVISFNLLADTQGFGGSPAETRAPAAAEILRTFKGDVLCLQEVSPGWFSCLKTNTGDIYKAVQSVRTVLFSKMNVIMYNTLTVTLIKSGSVQFSVGNDTRTRFAVWAVFEHKHSGRQYAVINCHFNLIKSNIDTGNSLSAANQSNELCALADELYRSFACPVIAAGDFNCREHKTATDSSYIYSRLTAYFTDARTAAESVFVGAKKRFDSTSGDHIFIIGTADVKSYNILALPHSETVSDHFAVFADFL